MDAVPRMPPLMRVWICMVREQFHFTGPHRECNVAHGDEACGWYVLVPARAPRRGRRIETRIREWSQTTTTARRQTWPNRRPTT